MITFLFGTFVAMINLMDSGEQHGATTLATILFAAGSAAPIIGREVWPLIDQLSQTQCAKPISTFRVAITRGPAICCRESRCPLRGWLRIKYLCDLVYVECSVSWRHFR